MICYIYICTQNIQRKYFFICQHFGYLLKYLQGNWWQMLKCFLWKLLSNEKKSNIGISSFIKNSASEYSILLYFSIYYFYFFLTYIMQISISANRKKLMTEHLSKFGLYRHRLGDTWWLLVSNQCVYLTK